MKTYSGELKDSIIYIILSEWEKERRKALLFRTDLDRDDIANIIGVLKDSFERTGVSYKVINDDTLSLDPDKTTMTIIERSADPAKTEYIDDIVNSTTGIVILLSTESKNNSNYRNIDNLIEYIQI